MRRLSICLVSLIVVTLMQRTSALPHYSDWSVPEVLGQDPNGPNSIYNDYGGALSKDGLSLYFTSARPWMGAATQGGGEDLYVSERETRDASFGPAVALATLNTPRSERIPTLSRDGHWLLFGSDRPNGFGVLDIWVSYREHTDDNLGWLPPVNLGAGINGRDNDTGPSYWEGDESHSARIYFARGTSLTTDLWVSEQNEDGTWGTALPVAELNTTSADAGAEIRHDGLEILFHSNRPGSQDFDIWVAARESVDVPFSAASLADALNSAAADQHAGLDGKGTELVLSSNRFQPDFVPQDLYLSRRVKSQPKTLSSR